MAKRLAGHRGNSARSIWIGLAISLAGFVNDIDTGIIASTIAQDTFKTYMYGLGTNSASVRAGIVSAFGSAGSASSIDKISRRWTLLLGFVVRVVGAVLQTAAQNPAMMIIPPAALLGLLTIILPYSPCWLDMKERYDEAKAVMYSLPSHRGSDVIEAEFAEMCSQIQLERNKKTMTNFYNLWTRKYIRRTLLACLTVNMMKLSGSNVIQNYRQKFTV
ncbi:hypothetical protein SAPIO_CDS2406 [Scedosporium apiospermum]|uniref:Major facilitator superfamily (MFS) profile domain-containing protein n=1 Tax=Pseudallescheria apiosperma TaxID=563466 RepID=A0A084GCF1_PSEDA|nr:uncharacterized protein SAPIO_CDS2406 [Scedosporium apiospermum]KEZ45013.1 hypothetical protein SAPIO_CDS2406 [Scedosporium apiospermum]